MYPGGLSYSPFRRLKLRISSGVGNLGKSGDVVKKEGVGQANTESLPTGVRRTHVETPRHPSIFIKKPRSDEFLFPPLTEHAAFQPQPPKVAASVATTGCGSKHFFGALRRASQQRHRQDRRQHNHHDGRGPSHQVVGP